MVRIKKKSNHQHHDHHHFHNEKDAPNSNLGFGTSFNGRHRLINEDGSFNIVRKQSIFTQLHLYQKLILMSWTKFWIVLVSFYVLLNCAFASLYVLCGIENLSGAGKDGMHPFWEAFFFSVQTTTTVGYGSISPNSFATNVVAAMGAFSGLMIFALATGLLFARFARPSSGIIHSDFAIITPYQNKGIQSFQFRIVNKRKHMLTDVEVVVLATWIEAGKRQIAPLRLEKDALPFFPLNWTIVHAIREDSPMKNWNKMSCQMSDAEFLIVIKAYDDAFADVVRTTFSYKWSEFKWGVKFSPMFYIHEEGHTVLEVDKLNSVEPI